MIKRFLKKWLPNPQKLHKEHSMRWVGHRLRDPRLWHINRHTVAGGIALGLFINFIPLPLQVLWATLLALLWRVNLPLTIVMTWINNPFTFIPINVMIYQIGRWTLGNTHTHMVKVVTLPTFEWRLERLPAYGSAWLNWFSRLGEAYLIGLPIVCLTASLTGYLLVRLSWRLAIQYRWRNRHRHQKTAKMDRFIP